MFFRELSRDFGTRVRTSSLRRRASSGADPLAAAADRKCPSANSRWLWGSRRCSRTEHGWWLVATSNDAPDAFPILHSVDLEHWEPKGFVFPSGQRTGMGGQGPQRCRLLGSRNGAGRRRILAVFTARQATNALAIGLARAPSPTGPWIDNGAPLITGKPVNTTGLGYDASLPQHERRSDRFPSFHRRGRRKISVLEG